MHAIPPPNRQPAAASHHCLPARLLAWLQVKKGPGMAWQEGHVWTAEVSLPPGTAFEFKVGAGARPPAVGGTLLAVPYCIAE